MPRRMLRKKKRRVLNRAVQAVGLSSIIKEMNLVDAKGTYDGPDRTTLQLGILKGNMSEPIAETMRPIVERSLSEVGGLQAYSSPIAKYRFIPFVPNVSADLTNYVHPQRNDRNFSPFGG